jgi:hypothetical protein
MSLRRLTVEKMVALSEAFLGAHQKALEQIPQTAGILVSVVSAHKNLFQMQEQVVTSPPTVREIYKRQVKLDQQHDNYYRCAYHQLISLIALYYARGDERRAELLTKLRDTIYPHGLAGVNFSYDEEAGAATLMERAMTDELKSLLRGIIVEQTPTETVTLFNVVHLQILLAKEIGTLEQQKKDAITAEQQNPGVTLRDHQRAIDAWINAFRTLERALRLAVQDKRITKEAADSFLKDIRDAEEKADREYLEEKKKAQEKAKKEEEAKQTQEID